MCFMSIAFSLILLTLANSADSIDLIDFLHLYEKSLLIPSGFNLTTRDSYFTILVEVSTNYISSNDTYFTNRIE